MLYFLKMSIFSKMLVFFGQQQRSIVKQTRAKKQTSTHHFLQSVNEVADYDAKASELLEHGAQFLAGALAHVRSHLVCLLAYNICGNGRTHVHDLCTLSHDVSVVWRGRRRGQSECSKGNTGAGQSETVFWLKQKKNQIFSE